MTLNNLSHAFPDDIDLVLVGPNGQGTLLMSDVGGGNSLSGVNLTFDDAAPSSLSDVVQIISGTFKPTNVGAKNDLFPAPAPQVYFSTNLSQFSGINPNGGWSLYIMDDESLDSGVLAAGWSIAITTFTPFVDLSVAQSAIPSPVAVGSNLTYTVTVANSGPAIASDVALADALPAGVTFVSASSTSGSCTHLAGVVTCTIGSINAGANVTATIVVLPTVAGTLNNQASVTSSTLDFVVGNNSASSSTAVIDPVIITAELSNQAICTGGNVIFAVTATGGAPSTYQWYHDAVLIPTATTASLVISGATVGDAGNYTVVVANAASAASSSAAFTVNPLPTVAVNNESICLGASAVLTATTSATNPTYLWSPGGATTASITVSPASTTIYTVTVADGTTTCVVGGIGIVTVQDLIQPTLTITHVGADVIVSWPQTCTTYVLEETLEFGAPTMWTPVTASITAVGADYQISVPAGAGNKFYRLKKQP